MVSKMAQWVEALTSRPDNASLIPGIHKTELAPKGYLPTSIHRL